MSVSVSECECVSVSVTCVFTCHVFFFWLMGCFAWWLAPPSLIQADEGAFEIPVGFVSNDKYRSDDVKSKGHQSSDEEEQRQEEVEQREEQEQDVEDDKEEENQEQQEHVQDDDDDDDDDDDEEEDRPDPSLVRSIHLSAGVQSCSANCLAHLLHTTWLLFA